MAHVLLADLPPTNHVAVWPFTPLANITPPQVRHADRISNGIDQFIQAALEEKTSLPRPQPLLAPWYGGFTST